MLWMMLLGCPSRDDGPGPGETIDTGTVPTVDPSTAVVDVVGAQDGPDVVLTLTTATAVTRTVPAVVTWESGDVDAVQVGVVQGTGTVALEVPAPCEQVDAGSVGAVVKTDGRRFDVVVPLVGVVTGDYVSVHPHAGLVVGCDEDDVLIDAAGGAYELRAEGALLEGFGDYGVGTVSFGSKAFLALDGRYTLTWKARPHHVMVRFVEL
jgi:hypothetical protein